MADTQTEQVSFDSPEVTDLIIEYRKGWANEANTIRDMQKLTGLAAPVCKALLDAAKSQKITDLRGYSKRPDNLKDNRKKKREPNGSRV
jgi:hypothetical protein